jgi:hypothetical protein
MSPAARLSFLAVAAVLSACTSVQQAGPIMDLPGETPKRPGLQVPPDAWAHPAEETASAPVQH